MMYMTRFLFYGIVIIFQMQGISGFFVMTKRVFCLGIERVFNDLKERIIIMSEEDLNWLNTGLYISYTLYV